jgi:PAS domain S-box-containing protein
MTAEAHGARRSTEPLDLQALIETIPALVMCTLADGTAEFANRAWQEYTGHPIEELAGRGWQATIHSDDLRKFFDEFSVGLTSGESFQSEARIRGAGGQYRWFSIKKTLVVSRTAKTEPSLRTLIACEDIDERKQQEAARRDIENKYRVLVQTATDAVVCMDETGAIVLANPATMRVFGYEPAELIGKPLTVLMPEFLRKVHEAGFRRYLATGQRHINWGGTELTGLRKNGQEFPVEISFGELTSDGHRIFTGFIRDISERKQGEEIQKQAQKAIQTMQAELARVSRLTTMGELTASIAHEIKQPMFAAAADAETCLRWLARDQPDVAEAQEAALRLIKDVTRASDIINRIVTLFKKDVPQRELVDVNAAIQEMIALLHSEASRYSISIHTELTEGLPNILADRVALHQVLMNLMLNGIEATSAVTERPRSLWVQSRIDESGDVLVAVSDSGTGFGLEADRVFTPFFTTKANGMGIGLPISRSLIEGHGGRLWATPNFPHGAVFSFTLPVPAGSPS